MTISKKRSRKIIVNNKQYFWKVSGNTLEKVLNGGVSITIQSPNSKFLSIKIDFLTAGIEHDFNEYTFVYKKFDELIVKPSMIRQFIEYALSQGWQIDKENYCLNIVNQEQLDEILMSDKNNVSTTN